MKKDPPLYIISKVARPDWEQKKGKVGENGGNLSRKKPTQKKGAI